MPNEAPFDPCRQWLGIDAVQLGNAHLVLGVSPQEADPMAVLRAAEARLTLLRTLSPGPFEMARAGLIKRVEEAREKLLAEIAANPPRPRPDTGVTFAMPAPPSPRFGGPPPVPPTRPGMPSPVPAALPPVPATVPPPVPPPVPGGEFHGGGVETIAIRTTVYRKKTPMAGIVLTVLALSGMAGGLVYYTYAGKSKPRGTAKVTVSEPGGQREVAGNDRDAVAMSSKAAADRGDGAPRRRDTKEEEPADPTSDRAVSTSKPRPKQMERISASPSKPKPEDAPAVDEVANDVVPPSMRMREVGKPAEEKTVAEKPVESKPAETKPAEEMPAEPAEQKNAPQKPPQAMAAAAAQLESTLGDVLEAMRRQEYDTVRRSLDEASEQASGLKAEQRVASWRQLATYYTGFLEYREKALAAVKPGDEYDVKNQKVGVVEVDDDKFIYRVAGGNKTVPRDKIPAGIVLAIVMKWFDSNPANDLYIGAYHLAKSEPDPQRAREHWEQAQASGADASGLMPLLGDPLFDGAE